ncbi:hypothetical protein ACFX16_014369 [Malus domestica]
MLVLSWNVRGLGNRRTFRDLEFLLQDNKPFVVFLSETRMNANQMGRLKFQLGMQGVLCVPRIGQEGGLCLLWRAGINVAFRLSYTSHIDVMVSLVDGYTFQFTVFYGNPN